MKTPERLREVMLQPLTAERLEAMATEGWRAAVVVWERPGGGKADPAAWSRQEVPYGMRISEDCLYLEEHREETRAMIAMMEGIVADQPFSRIAEDLNKRGFNTRSGGPWTQTAVFDLLPRLIECGPQLLNREEWISRREAVLSAAR